MPKQIVSLVTTAPALDALLPEWTRLFYTSATPNPLAHPVWIAGWARHFIRPEQLSVVVARDEAGSLLGVAPFYRRRYVLGGIVVTILQLLGTGPHCDVTELPQVLAIPRLERATLRAMLHFLGEHAAEWDWIEMSLTPEQGWFEPQWLPQEGRGAGSFVVHKGTRPCVVLALPPTWEELHTSLKRNVKESIRRGANSLSRAGHTWQTVTPGDTAPLNAVLDRLVALHHARAGVRGKVRHPNYFSTPADITFLRAVAGPLFAAGHLTPSLLRVDGEDVAGRLVLHANGTTLFSFSGFSPAWWKYNVATTLMAECLRHAIMRGDTLANLAPGPDVAKLRWAERLHLYQDFVMVGPRRRSRVAFSLYWQLRSAALIRRERYRHEDA